MDLDDIMAPRLEYYLFRDLNETEAERTYKELLKVILLAQEFVLDANPNPCIQTNSSTFQCSIGCPADYSDGIQQLGQLMHNSFQKCPFYYRKINPLLQGVAQRLEIEVITGS